MRILYFTRDYTSHDHRFLNALADTGNEVYSLRLEKRGVQREDRPLPPEIIQQTWKNGLTQVERSEYRRYAREFRSILQQIQPDVVHAGSIQTAALVAAMAGTENLVSMSWGYDMLMDAHSTDRMLRDTRKTLQSSKRVVCDCNPVHDAVTGFGFPPEHIIQFPWGTDILHFHPAGREKERHALGLTDDQFVILSLRAWEPIYDVETILKAFIQAVRMEPALFLLLMGGGSQQNHLRQMLIQAGVMDSVLFGGRIPYAELPRYYRSADLYVSASLTDGSSVSLLEALACGTPAIVSDIPGNREWVHEGMEGWFFPTGDVDSLTEKMLRAYHSRHQLPEMGKHARARIEENADWQKNFPKLLQAYQGLVNDL